MIPKDFRIEVVPVRFEGHGRTEYEVHLTWTAPDLHKEVVYLTHSESEKEALSLAVKARNEMKSIVGEW